MFSTVLFSLTLSPTSPGEAFITQHVILWVDEHHCGVALINVHCCCGQNYSKFAVLFDGHQRRSAFVLHQEHDEFRWFGLACVPPYDMNIVRPFVKRLPRR